MLGEDEVGLAGPRVVAPTAAMRRVSTSNASARAPVRSRTASTNAAHITNQRLRKSFASAHSTTPVTAAGVGLVKKVWVEEVLDDEVAGA